MDRRLNDAQTLVFFLRSLTQSKATPSPPGAPQERQGPSEAAAAEMEDAGSEFPTGAGVVALGPSHVVVCAPGVGAPPSAFHWRCPRSRPPRPQIDCHAGNNTAKSKGGGAAQGVPVNNWDSHNRLHHGSATRLYAEMAFVATGTERGACSNQLCLWTRS